MPKTGPKYLKGPCRSCSGHVEFPVEMIGTIIDCPHCGKPTELLLAVPPQEPAIPRKAILWTMVAVLVLALGLGGALMALKRAERWASRRKEQAAASSPADPAAPKTEVAPPADDAVGQSGFQVSPVTLEKAPGTSLIYAVGTIQNNSARQRFGVKVELDLLDAAGTKIGVAKDYLQVLEPNSDWPFRALVVESKAASAKLASIKEDQ